MRTRGSRRWWATSLVLLVGTSVVVLWLGSRAQSPEQAAAKAAEPPAGWITAEVEQRVLSSTVILRGDVRSEVSLSVGVPSSVEGTGVVTAVAVKPGDVVIEGQRLVEVSGRPVFVLEGAVPAFRPLKPGMSGADVTQLQLALARLGFAPDGGGVFGDATKAALTAWYQAAGYEPVPSSVTVDADVAAAQRAVVDAQAALDFAEVGLVRAGQARPDSVIAQAQSTLNSAQRAFDEANAKAIADQQDNQATLDAAHATLARLTADPMTPAADSDQARVAVVQAQSVSTTVELSDSDAIQTASEQVWVATLALQEAQQSGDVQEARITRDGARTTRDAAQSVLSVLRQSTGPTIARGEVVFVPTLPARVQSAVSVLGPLDASGPGVGSSEVSTSAGLVSLAAGRLVVSTTVRSGDAGLVRVGMPVQLLDETTSTTYPGSVQSIADTATTSADGSPGFAALIALLDPLPTALSGANLRLTITAAATDREVLVVPLAAVSSSATGQARVSVLSVRSSAPVDLAVTAGLSADGFVAVKPVESGALKQGDLVVIGR